MNFGYDNWIETKPMPNSIGTEWISKGELPGTHGRMAYQVDADVPDSIWLGDVEKIKEIANVNPPSFVNSLQTELLKNEGVDLHINKTSYFMARGENFIYPIDLQRHDFLDEIVEDGLCIPDDVLNYIRLGKASVVIWSLTEGFPFHDRWAIAIDRWAKKLGIQGRVFFMSCNLISENLRQKYLADNIIDDTFKCLPWDYFGAWPWFVDLDKAFDNTFNVAYRDLAIKKINDKKSRNLYFLNYNRRPHWHRVLLACTIISSPFSNKGNVSLGARIQTFRQFLSSILHPLINRPFKYKDSFYDYILLKHKHDQPIVFDGSDLDINLAMDFDDIAHFNTYFSIVTETWTHYDTVFFSEKIYKPVYGFQPFILWGNPNSLKYFRKLGYKTFSKWIDESYDDEVDEIRRFDKIIREVERLSNISKDEWNDMLVDMIPVLEHNYNRLMLCNTNYNDFIQIINGTYNEEI